MQSIRWGILGAARIAQDALIRAIQESTDGDLIAIASRNGDTAARIAREHGIPRSYGSYDELLADAEIDAVYLPLPNALHAAWVLRAVDAGKAVLCEKPFAMTEAEAATMIAAAEQQPTLVAEAFMYRYHPQIDQALALVRDGAIGTVRLVRTAVSYNGFQDPSDIRYNRSLGGGALMDLGTYGVNLIRLVFGAEPQGARSIANRSPGGVDELFVGLLEFPGGRVGVVDCSFLFPWQARAEILGDAGRIDIENFVNPGSQGEARLIVRASGQKQTLVIPPANAYCRMVDAFNARLLHNRPLPFPAEDAIANMRAIDLLYASANAAFMS